MISHATVQNRIYKIKNLLRKNYNFDVCGKYYCYICRMIFRLYKLSEGLVVTLSQPEEGINTEVKFFDDKVDENGLFSFLSMFTNTLTTYLVTGIEENRRYVYKVIARQGGIDISSLTDEERKRIGYFDIEKLAKETTQKYINEREKQTAYLEFIEGFKKALSLLENYTLKSFEVEADILTDGTIKITKIL